jgi:hypothetical protein
MSKYYTIKITGGAPQGPYTIYLNQNNGIVATLYPQLTSASNLTYIELTTGLGVSVIVPDDTSTLFLYNTYSGCLSGITLIPTTTITYSDFCLSVKAPQRRDVITHFIYYGLDSNSRPIWVDEFNPNSTINWVNNQWLLSTTIYGNTMFSTSQLTPSVTFPSFWQNVSAGPGASLITSIDVDEGSCPLQRLSSFQVSINQPTCLCDGSIIFNVNLDNPPFSYSIDNGVTYSSSPIFTNLCSGIYILSVVDSLGETFSNTITLNKPEMATTYSILLNTTISTPVSNELSLVKSYETTIQVIPPLPDGATITFNLIHTNSFYSSPTSGTSVLTTGTVLSKNVTPITIGSTTTGQTQSVNTTPGCQSDFIYQSNIDDTWNSLTLTNTDTITISTTTRVDKTTTGLCVVGYSNDSYSISNAVISGCDCCSLIVNT